MCHGSSKFIVIEIEGVCTHKADQRVTLLDFDAYCTVYLTVKKNFISLEVNEIYELQNITTALLVLY